MRTLGTKPGGALFEAGIDDPRAGSVDFLSVVALDSMSLVTSGSYQRFFTVDGKDYHHIIDKNTLFPASGFISVSVICADSALADALSTSLFLMTVEEGMALVESLDGVFALWLLDSGEIRKSEGFERFIPNG